jgi:hypothetical protein
MAVLIFNVLLLGASWAQGTGAAPEKEAVEATVLVEITVKDGSSQTKASQSGVAEGLAEASAWIPMATSQTEHLCRFESKPSAEEGILSYMCTILASSDETEPKDPHAQGPDDEEVRAERQRLISEGLVRAEIHVDRRGRPRVVADLEQRGQRWARVYLHTFPTALFPALPEVGQPFQAGQEWVVKSEGEYLGSDGVNTCESVKVWTDGRVEIVMSFRRELGGLLSQERWLIAGSPPSVREYWSSDRFERPDEVRLIERHARVLSGGIPVRPVDHAPGEDKPAGGEP